MNSKNCMSCEGPYYWWKTNEILNVHPLPPDSFKISSLKRSVRRYRVFLETFHSNPSSLEDLIIRNSYSRCTKSSLCYIIAVRNIIEDYWYPSTKTNLELLATYDHWYADGTSSSFPLLFPQMYTVNKAKFSTYMENQS